jgi:hypothetical protein
MCLACEMEAMWFAVMEARDRTGSGEAVSQPDETVQPNEWATPGLLPRSGEAPTLLPPPERGRVGEGVAGGMHETADSAHGRSADPHPNPPPEEGGGGAPSVGKHSVPPRRFACEETSTE